MRAGGRRYEGSHMENDYLGGGFGLSLLAMFTPFFGDLCAGLAVGFEGCGDCLLFAMSRMPHLFNILSNDLSGLTLVKRHAGSC